jgi:hypothetical protein
MAIYGYLSSSDSVGERRIDYVSAPDLVEADRLICDLAALVDAGLVVVEPHVLGPARYAVPSTPLEDTAPLEDTGRLDDLAQLDDAA